MELNFFAAAEMTRAVLPQMRRRGSGNVITVSSIAGLVAMNAAGPYCAAKFALEGWTESLAIEAGPLGIHVTTVEPGAFRTEFAGDVNMRPTQRIEAYRPSIAPFETYRRSPPADRWAIPPKRRSACWSWSLTAPPVRLMLGRDAYAMWDTTLAKRQQELNARRERGRHRL